MSQKKFIIIVTALIFTVGVLSFLLSPLFKLNSFEVRGLENLEEKKVEMVVNSFMGKNIWIVDISTLKKRLKKIGYIDQVNISRDYPNSLLINIKERKPLAMVNNKGKFLVFCPRGNILEKSEERKKHNIPLIQGIGYVFSQDKLIFSSRMKHIITALEKREQTTLAKMKQIKYNEQQLDITLESDVEIYMGQMNDIDKKFSLLESAVRKITNEDLNVEYIDLKVTNRPVIKKQ